MIEKESIPFAPHLIESMRSIGYSFETAIADLIDNSISANAKRIDINLTPDVNPKLIIFDDGDGMDALKLEEALRYGSRSPLDERDETDLGRFGLGLKSASLSQCRKLIVASKKNGTINCFSWDLDTVIDKKGWIILQYDEDHIAELPMIDLFDKIEHGTYVLLQNFDRISSSTSDLSKTLNSNMNTMINHIALVFHRFLDCDVNIFVNNEKIEPLDPFLSYHKSTQILREQYFEINNARITVQPYILPIINKLSANDIQKVGGKQDLRTKQGFYIYRNKRLIIHGTWFALARKDELGKLARVRVDIPNSLDYMWGIDVKKSAAFLPDLIKKNLFISVDESILKSKIVHEYRGRKTNNADINYIWERMELRDGCYEYKINRKLPQIEILRSNFSNEQVELFDVLIDSIESAFPTNSIYLDASKGEIEDITDKDLEELYDDIKLQLNECEKNGLNSAIMLKILLKTEPYCRYEKLKEKFAYEEVVL